MSGIGAGMIDDEFLKENPEPSETPEEKPEPAEGTTEVVTDPAPAEETKPEPVESEEPKAEPEAPAPTPEPPQVDYAELMRQRGLDKQFRDPVDLINRAPIMNQYIERLHQERAELIRALQRKNAQPQVEMDPEMQAERDRLREAGFVTKEEMERIERRQVEIETAREQERAQAFIRERKDFNELFPVMEEIYANTPEVHGIPISRVVPLLYDAAKGRKLPEILDKVKQPAPVAPVDQTKKAQAQTVSKSTKTREYTAQDFTKMTPEEIEKHIPMV